MHKICLSKLILLVFDNTSSLNVSIITQDPWISWDLFILRLAWPHTNLTRAQRQDSTLIRTLSLKQTSHTQSKKFTLVVTFTMVAKNTLVYFLKFGAYYPVIKLSNLKHIIVMYRYHPCKRNLHSVLDDGT